MDGFQREASRRQSRINLSNSSSSSFFSSFSYSSSSSSSSSPFYSFSPFSPLKLLLLGHLPDALNCILNPWTNSVFAQAAHQDVLKTLLQLSGSNRILLQDPIPISKLPLKSAGLWQKKVARKSKIVARAPPGGCPVCDTITLDRKTPKTCCQGG